jgi:hypothetical protein
MNSAKANKKRRRRKKLQQARRVKGIVKTDTDRHVRDNLAYVVCKLLGITDSKPYSYSVRYEYDPNALCSHQRPA